MNSKNNDSEKKDLERGDTKTNAGKRKHIMTAVIAAVIILAVAGIVLLVWKGLSNRNKLENAKITNIQYMGVNGVGSEKEEELVQMVRKTVAEVSKEDYDSLFASADDVLKKELDADSIKEAKNAINADWGSFVSYGTLYYADISDENETSMVAQINVSYKNVSVTYTLTYDEANKLEGIFMK